MIVILSDHGHALFDIPDPPETNGHGYKPYKPLSRTLFALKGQNQKTSEVINSGISSLDIFPTILKKLNVDYKEIYSSLPFSGLDIYERAKNPEKQCMVTFKAEHDMARSPEIKPKYLSTFAFDNGKRKMMFEFTNNKKIFLSSGIKLLQFSDSDDQIIDRTFNEEELSNYVKDEFENCFYELFNDFKLIKFEPK